MLRDPLPIELVDCVLSLCDHDSLKAMTLVCHGWLPLTRSYLFPSTKAISLSRLNAEELTSLLSSTHSTLSPSLRYLYIQLSHMFKSEEVDDEITWLNSVASLLSAKAVQSLQLQFVMTRGDRLFKESSSLLVNAFHAITTLDVDFINHVSLIDAIQFACGFPALKRLKLTAVVRSNYLANSSAGLQHTKLPIGLISLDLHFPWLAASQKTIIEWLMYQQVPLQNLTIDLLHHECFPLIEEWVTHLSTLQTLALNRIEVEDTMPHGLNLGHLPNLISLKLYPFITDISTSTIAFVYNTLLSIQDPTILQKAIIVISEYDISLDDILWPALDELLALSKYQSIQFGTANVHSLTTLLPICYKGGKLFVEPM